ncbi:aldose 1-epimerase family protein [Sinomonas mesophila]|uniref:aldose 1-epimerase family protein n=1 Tax=Sinomonas mesophila TaxID=1531955 RepID=UPI000986835F|nr:aldose 1-epimerase family protein [Sinomonas mesophila]
MNGALEYEIAAGDYTAVVTARGAALRTLAHRGRDLVVPFAAGGPIPDYRGVIAAPWPNRIADGAYTFDGAEHRLPVNEPERGCALHGLAFDRNWALVDADARSVVLALDLAPTPGYPFALRLEAGYRLGEDGLDWEVRAVNMGRSPAPYGVCPHPYLVAGESPLDEWELWLPADTFLEVTPDRLLPVATRSVDRHAFDFRARRRIGTTEIDHAFTDLGFDAAGRARLELWDPAGTGVAMEWDASCPWLQLHTADKQPPLPNRLGLAVEPMTCPPDAFNSGTDLVRLPPGGDHRARWRILGLSR